MDGGNQGTYRSKFANHDQRNQMGKYVEKVQRFFAENILAIRIEKYKSEEFAIEVHGHGEARAITLLCDTPGMFVQAFSKYRQIIHNTRRAAFQYFLQRTGFTQPGLILDERMVSAAAVDEGFHSSVLGS